jgi:hypothetical protein
VRLELQDIFRAHGEAYRQTHALGEQQRKVMHAIEVCRTPALGGHLDVCPGCGDEQPSYNSCRDRHCPKCQALRQAKWVAERQERILNTHHFHVVFTVPGDLKPLASSNRERFFAALFKAAADTLLELGADDERLGAQLGITAVLHTWTRELNFHPHLHCVVTGGGLSKDGKAWVPAHRRYLFPVKVLSRLFRGKLLAALVAAHRRGELYGPAAEDEAFLRLKATLYEKEWVVYAKRPFGGPAQVFGYLGRYTHRVAISNQRLLSMDERGVRFVTRGDATATLAPQAFIGRFLQHVLPSGFVKIRHYGLLAAGNVNTRLEAARALLAPVPVPQWALVLWLALSKVSPEPWNNWRTLYALLTGVDPLRCVHCGELKVRLPLPCPSPAILDSS